ncbi:hypothetical protein INR49_026418, partial [Caranx melampygus]
MAEGGVGTLPQVFVVDSHLNYTSIPSKKRERWARVGQKSLLLLTIALYEPNPVHMNLSSPRASGQQGGVISPRMGSREQPHPDQIQQRPFAHLMGSDHPSGDKNVVQWNEGGEAIIRNMSYNKGRLVVEKEGYYYLYSKVQLNTAEECVLIQHRVMKDTKAYGESIELMKSKSLRCRSQKSSNTKTSDAEDLWNSFLAGIFHLQVLHHHQSSGNYCCHRQEQKNDRYDEKSVQAASAPAADLLRLRVHGLYFVSKGQAES